MVFLTGYFISRFTEECNAVKQDAFSIEPSPFTASNHPLLVHSEFEAVRGQTEVGLECETEYVWQDGLCVNPESTSLHPTTGSDYHNDCSNLIASHWDFGNPGRLVKKKPKGRTSSREKSKDRSRFNSKFPFHKKAEALDELAWALDHNEMLCGGANLAGNHGASHGQGNHRSGMAAMRPPGSVRALDSIAHSPASVGAAPTPLASAMTPKGGPGSVRTPGDFSASMASPADCKPPGTPKSVPPNYPVASPYPQPDKKPELKTEFDESMPASSTTAATALNATTTAAGGSSTYVTSSLGAKSELTSSEHLSENSSLPLKRPRLPLKEYESGLDSEVGSLSDSIYDTQYLQHWLNHPVKKFRPNESKPGDPLRPMYRRPSQSADSPKQSEVRMEVEEEDNSASNSRSSDSAEVNGKAQTVIKAEPFEFVDGQEIKKEIKVNFSIIKVIIVTIKTSSVTF